MLLRLTSGRIYQSCRLFPRSRSEMTLRTPLVRICGRRPISQQNSSIINFSTVTMSSQFSNHLSPVVSSTMPNLVCRRNLEAKQYDVLNVWKRHVHKHPFQMEASGSESKVPSKTGLPTTSPQVTSPNQPPMPPKRRPPKKMSNFVFQKFYDFVQGYQQLMETRFPQAMQVYRVFVVGFKDFSKELAEYVKITTKALLSSDGVLRLSRNELDVYYRMPREMFRVAPTLLLSALPGFQYIIFPIAYKFPKRLLSSHFWSLQQKSQFAIEGQKSRLYNQRPVLRQLQNNVELITDERLKEICRDILFKLGSGSQPSIREIMKIKPLFESQPFSIAAMHGPHVKSLCRLHGIHTWFFNRSRLFDRAEMLYIMDLSLIREGIFTLKPDEIRHACFLRGLNAANTSQEDMVEFLQQWASVSSSIQPHSYSLLLHLPVLLAYNNPNNWALLS